MENTFIIRHYLPAADIGTLSLLLTEIEAHDHDGENTSEAYLRSMESWPNFDPEQNVWVAELAGAMVGFGQILSKKAGQGTAYVAVHPAQRRKGLGSRLLKLILARAQETQSTVLLIYANGANQAANHFLHQRGFDVVGKSGAFFRPALELPEAQFPAGYALRRYDAEQDTKAIVQALNACYRGMWGHQQEVESADRYIEYYGTTGIHLLFDAQGELVSICAAKPAGKQDERGLSDLLDAPGVVQAHRDADFQRLMVIAIMRWLREQGERPVTLEYWGETPQALQAYQELGFQPVAELLTYHKELI